LEDKQSNFDKLRDTEIDMSDVEEEDGDSFTLKTAKKWLKGKKMPVPYISPEDMEDIQFPEKMDGLTDEQLTQAMADWTKLMSYTKYVVSEMDVEKTAKANAYNFQKSKAWATMREKGASEEDTRKGVERMGAVANAKKDADIASAKYKLMDSLLWGYTKNYQMLSRELTKRGIINPAEGGKGANQDI
jgi:hypothetical protein